MTEQQPERGPVDDQREDGVVVEPGGELDRDLQEHDLGEQAGERPGEAGTA
jgi:hypothetical protein